MSNPPGHYHAQGDPPDTVRYWDGSQWVGDPMPAPPAVPPPPPSGAPAPPPPPGAAPVGGARFASLGVRFGAAAIDTVIVIVVTIILLAVLFGSSDGDGGFEAFASGGESILLNLIVTAAYIGIIVAAGATPGKLMLGLRITEADGETPVTPRGAVMRSLPYIIGLIPFLGFIAVVGCIIAALIMISNDTAERRSVYDRLGNTRVVHK